MHPALGLQVQRRVVGAFVRPVQFAPEMIEVAPEQGQLLGGDVVRFEVAAVQRRLLRQGLDRNAQLVGLELQVVPGKAEAPAVLRECRGLALQVRRALARLLDRRRLPRDLGRLPLQRGLARLRVALGVGDLLPQRGLPGGDVALSLSQSVPVAGSVVVTTPQTVSVADTRRAVRMYQKLNVPTLGLIENMSHFVCPTCRHESDIFGKGGGETLATELNIPFLGRVPIYEPIRIGGRLSEAVPQREGLAVE